MKKLNYYILCIAVVFAYFLSPMELFAKEPYQIHSPIPGPNSCFWTRGPHNKDPYINTAYPDAGAIYWGATFTIPDGAKLDLQGEFAYSRYQSIISYDEKGRPVDTLAGYLIKPITGSVNPFVVGNQRNKKNRSYRVNISSSQMPEARIEGKLLKEQSRNRLYAPPYRGNQQTVLYRIYIPNKGLDVDGGVRLPNPVLTLSDGTRLEGFELCDEMNTKQQLTVTHNAMGIPPQLYWKMLHIPGKPATWPATNPSTWHIQLDRKSLIGIYTGDTSVNPRRSEGGFYPNPDNNYIRTVINRKHGKVFVLKGKMPVTPKTFNGDEVLTKGELVYMSICSNQGFANTRVNDCLYDEQIPVDDDGYYTVMVSREADRPRNANARCGYGWLPMADDGDGIFDEDSSIVQIRHMLADRGFKHSIQKIDKPGNEAEVMKEYYPKTFYLMQNTAETFFLCK